MTVLPVYVNDRMAINEDFNGMVFVVEMDTPYMTLTFTSCRPTAKIKRTGIGFKAIVRHKGKKLLKYVYSV